MPTRAPLVPLGSRQETIFLNDTIYQGSGLILPPWEINTSDTHFWRELRNLLEYFRSLVGARGGLLLPSFLRSTAVFQEVSFPLAWVLPGIRAGQWEAWSSSRESVCLPSSSGTSQTWVLGPKGTGNPYVGLLHMLPAAFPFSPGVPCTENDYKLWSPSDERGNECLLGHKTVFKRRTPHATCFNGEDFDRPVVVSNCSCTRQDYEWLVLLRCLGTGSGLAQPAVWHTD